jgi:hypothetical protein
MVSEGMIKKTDCEKRNCELVTFSSENYQCKSLIYRSGLEEG